MMRGRFSATVAGDVDFSMSGSAVFDRRPNADDGRWIFLIVLTHESHEGDGTHQITMSNALTGPLAPGSYQLSEMGPRSFVALYSTTTEGGASGSYSADRGQLEVTESSTTYVTGRFRFTGSGSSNFDLWAVDGTVVLDGVFFAEISPDAFAIAFERDTKET